MQRGCFAERNAATSRFRLSRAAEQVARRLPLARARRPAYFGASGLAGDSARASTPIPRRAASWSCGPVKPQETATWRAKENPFCWQPIATLCVLGPMGIATTLARRAQAKRRWLGEWDAWAAANIAPDRQATQQEAFGFYTSRKSARGLTVNSDRVIPWGSVQRWLWESGKLGLR
jgi:hypothetical protein